MTTVAAVKKGRRLCIASDSLALFGSRKEIDGKHVYGKGKIIQVGSNYIGMSGHPAWGLILNYYFLKLKRIPEWKMADQIFEFFCEMHQALKNNYFLDCKQSNFLPFEDSAYELLIINPNGIFEVEYSRLVRQYSKFSAIGTGEDYALGAIKAIYDKIDDPMEIAKIGIEAAAQFDRKTEIPVHTYSIDLSIPY